MLNRTCILFILLLVSFGCTSKKAQPESKDIKVDTTTNYQVLYHEIMPIEDFTDDRISTEKFYSGKKSLQIGSNLEFSFGFKKQIGEITNFNAIDSLEINLMILSPQKLKDVKVVWTIDDENGKNLFWSGSNIENKKLNDWTSLKLNFNLNKALVTEKNKISIYVWNPNKETLWVDDFEFNLLGKIIVEPSNSNNQFNFYFDFENSNELLRPEKISAALSRSGKLCCNLSDGGEYGIGVKKYFNEFGNQIIKKLAASVWVYPTEKNHDLVLTFSCVDEKTGKVKFWQGKSTLNGDFPLNQWTILNSAVNLPTEVFNINDPIEVGIWNKGKTAILCDDLHIVYGGENEKNSLSEVDAKNVTNSTFLNQKLLHEVDANVSILQAFKPSNQLHHGLFYKAEQGIESILHIQKNEVELLYFDQKMNALTTIWQSKDKDNFLLNGNNYFEAGDFDGDHIGELLVVNKQNFNWAIYQFESNSWQVKIKGEQVFPVEFFNHYPVVKNVVDSKIDVIVNSLNDKRIILQLVNKKWMVKDFTNKKMPISKHDILLNWNEKSFLKLNTDWRFELKQIDAFDNKYEITSAIDFEKNATGINPKYYEYTKLLSGNFLNKNKMHLLVLYFNCNNENQKENNCDELEQNKDFPNGIGIYE